MIGGEGRGLFVPSYEYNVLLRAGQFNRTDVLRAWLEWYPNWDMESPSKNYGSTILLQYVYYAVILITTASG